MSTTGVCVGWWGLQVGELDPFKVTWIKLLEAGFGFGCSPQRGVFICVKQPFA